MIPTPSSLSPVSKDEPCSFSTSSYKVIYAYSDNSEAHKGRLKIGDATIYSDKSWEAITQDELNEAAQARIDSYTSTADIDVTLELAVLAVRPARRKGAESSEEEALEGFRDYKVHRVLQNSGFSKVFARAGKKRGEWFELSVVTARKAIDAVIAYEDFIGEAHSESSIVLRPEQETAVTNTAKALRKGELANPKRMLWNAKMRFGKTLTAYSLVDRLNAREDDSIKRVLIMTHRPDVNSSWSEDFSKIFTKDSDWLYGSKRNGSDWEHVSQSSNFFWFASIQDLRGSYGAKDALSDADFAVLAKNEHIFNTEWDLIITDEAHEGSLTPLAKQMFAGLKSRYFLDLSGTPFNLVQVESWADEELAERFSYDGQYNWSYPDERRAKAAWAKENPNGDANPYDELPEIRFVTYDVSDSIAAMKSDSSVGSISFTELFRPERDGVGNLVTPRKFVNEAQVIDLLNKMRGDKKYSNDPRLFPYNAEFASHFRHSLWMLPSVPACEAMEELLKQHHSGFSGWAVVNATGAGNDAREDEKTALEAVKKAISKHENTITLSQGMLTTGVTVPEWTAVFMLNNTTSPMLYMQTAFRGTSPGSLPDGRVKEAAYVFDFNPDRCLREIVEIAKANAKVSLTQDPVEQEEFDKESTNEYLEHISVLSMVGSKFVQPDSNAIMEQLNEAYVNEVIAKGFDSPRLWNTRQLAHFDIQRAKILEVLRRLQGGSAGDTHRQINVSKLSEADKQHLLDLKQQEIEARKKLADSPKPLSPEEQAKVKELEGAKKADAKNRQNAVSVLAGIAARMPMLVFASPADEVITPQNFAELIDEESWREFMPKNLLRLMPKGTKTLEKRQEALGDEGLTLYWEDVRRFFDPVIFKLATERIRQLTRDADTKQPLERAFRIAALFSHFKNPDKETVLTPWRVVNLQYGKTLGGLQFVDLENSTAKDVLVYTKNIETAKLESHSQHKAVALLDAGTHEVAPVWRTSDVDPVEGDGKDFWEDRELSIYDINSKTALYPLYAACSVFYAQRPHYRQVREQLGHNSLTEEELDAELWKEIIEKVIFLNCRVEYSRKIAERVLCGFDDKTQVNASVIDVIKFKKAIESWNEIKRKSRPVFWQKIEDVNEFIGIALRLSSPRFLEHLSQESFADKSNALVINFIDKINDGELSMKEFNNLKKIVESYKNDLTKFTVNVGNQPYQKSENGINSDIWQDFIAIAATSSHRGVFIHPGRWVVPKKNMKKVQSLLINAGLKSFDYLSTSPFIGVAIDGNVTITEFEFGSAKKDVYFSVNSGVKQLWKQDEMFFSNSFEKELYNAVADLLDKGSMDDLVIGSLCSLGGQDFGYSKIDHISKLRKTDSEMNKPVKIWANSSFGKGSRFEWFFIDESEINLTEDYYKATSSRKIMLDKKGHSPSYPAQSGNVFNNSAEIVDKATIASGKVFLMPLADEKEDLILMASLMMTKTARCLMSITQKDLYVRGLDNIPLYSSMKDALFLSGRTQFDDEWLYSHFKFSKSLIEYIEKSISSKSTTISIEELNIASQ